MNRLLLELIGIYQRHLSPRKGWRCAYSKLHGGPGCSGYAREAIETYGWKTAIPLVRQRFRDCHTAGDILRARRQGLLMAAGGPAGPGGRRNRGQQGSGDAGAGDAGDACDILDIIPGCNSDSDSSCHLPNTCDFSSCHFGGCDSCNCDGCDSCNGCDGCDGCNCGN